MIMRGKHLACGTGSDPAAPGTTSAGAYMQGGQIGRSGRSERSVVRAIRENAEHPDNGAPRDRKAGWTSR